MTCGKGRRTRRRTCHRSSTKIQCTGRPVEVKKCGNPCPGIAYSKKNQSLKIHIIFSYFDIKTHILFLTVACKRVCPGGRPNKNCSYCICDGQTLHGEVFTVTGVPVADATVALASQAKVIRAHTDSKGQFKIEGLCTNPQTQIVISKDKFAPTTVPVSINSTDEVWVRAVLPSSGKEKENMKKL